MTCTTVVKTGGDTVELKIAPMGGTAPYRVKYWKQLVPPTWELLYEQYDIPESISSIDYKAIYNYIITDEDVVKAYQNTPQNVIRFASVVDDLCPTGNKESWESCEITLTCGAPKANFTTSDIPIEKLELYAPNCGGFNGSISATEIVLNGGIVGDGLACAYSEPFDFKIGDIVQLECLSTNYVCVDFAPWSPILQRYLSYTPVQQSGQNVYRITLNETGNAQLFLYASGLSCGVVTNTYKNIKLIRSQ